MCVIWIIYSDIQTNTKWTTIKCVKGFANGAYVHVHFTLSHNGHTVQREYAGVSYRFS